MTKELRILLLEDRLTDAELVLHELARQQIHCNVKRVMTEADFLEQLRIFQPDLILADYALPAYNGLSALASVRQTHPEMPFIFVSGALGEETAIEALHYGATDYVLKQRMSRLGPAVQRALREAQQGRERARAEKQIYELNLLLRAIRGINQIIAHERDPKRLFDNACDLLVQTRSYKFAWVGLTKPDSKQVVPSGQAGTGAGYLEAVTVTWDESPSGQGPVGTAIRTRQPWVSQNTATDPRFALWKELALGRGFASLAAVPMIHGTRLLGALAVYSDRTEAFVEEEIKLLTDLAADLAFAMESIENANERKRAEEEARDSTQFNQQIIACAQEGIVVYGRDLKYKVWNPYLERMTGYRAEEVLGRHPRELFPFLRESGVLGALEKALTGEIHSVQFPFHIGSSGRSGWSLDTTGPLRDAKGDIIGVIGIVHDITERKRAEIALRESEERLRQFAENINEVCWIAALEQFQLLYISPVYEKIWGRSCRSLYANPSSFIESIHEEDRALALAAVQAVGRGEAFDLEHRIMRPDGQIRWIHARGTVIRNETGAAYRVVGIAEDITRRKETEQQFRQAQKMEGIGQLAGGVAHDFNNILMIIQANLELLLMTEQNLSTECKDHITEITHAADRAATLNRQLLTFSRREAMQMQLLELNDLTVSFTKMLRRIVGEHIRVQNDFAPTPLPIKADPGMIEQVLMNLAINARDAMPNGGQLIIGTEAVVIDQARANLDPRMHAGDFSCLSVRDTGNGIAPENMSHIFEPFFTTKGVGKGTGLGLATVFGIAEQHKGWVDVSSKVGVGTTFRVFFPIALEGIGAPDLTAGHKIRGGTEKVLLVEDEEGVRKVLFQILAHYGYSVVEADSGITAQRIWAEHGGQIDLLITDMVMPGGLTGLELIDLLRVEKPGLKVMLMSGYSADLARGDIARAKGINFFHKPFTNRILAEAVRKCLDAV